RGEGRLREPRPGDGRFGPGDDRKVGVRTGPRGGLDLPDVLLHRNQLASDRAVKAASFGKLVVLDADPGRPGSFELPYGPDHVDRVAEAVVAVGDHRDADRVHDAADPHQPRGAGDDG